MREAAIEAGIMTKHLSLALEPEAASLFCSYLPVEKLQGDSGSQDFRLVPGKRHLVLDAGGSTVDITVRETLADGRMGVLYKANAIPWGSTKIDDAFLKFLDDVTGEDTNHTFMVDFKEDYLDLLREFEIKKKSFGVKLNAGQEVTFRIPLSIHETYQKIYGHDFMTSLMMKQDLKDQITFFGDKLRVKPEQVEKMFEQTCNKIVDHLKDIFSKPEVTGTDTILMVGGFSESVMLQRFIKVNFPNKKMLIPEDAGLAVLKGAVIFGHNPKAIPDRVATCTYGVETTREFIPGVHPESKKKIYDGVARCTGLFDIHVTEGQAIHLGQEFVTRTYFPITRSQKSLDLSLYISTKRDPVYTDEDECFYLGKVSIDISNIQKVSERDILVKIIYGATELGVEARVVKTGVVLNAKFDFLG